MRLWIKVEEAVASRVNHACKISSFPMILSHYLATLKNAGFIEQAEFFQKKLSKANKVLPCRAKPLDLKSFVSRLAVRLAQSFRDFQYMNAVEAHARLIADRAVKGASDEIRGKNPILVAAACLCAADDLFGNRIGTERICKVTGVGDGVRRLSAALKRIAPLPLKGEWTVWREGTRVGALRRLARHKVMRHVMREKEVRA